MQREMQSEIDLYLVHLTQSNALNAKQNRFVFFEWRIFFLLLLWVILIFFSCFLVFLEKNQKTRKKDQYHPQ